MRSSLRRSRELREKALQKRLAEMSEDQRAEYWKTRKEIHEWADKALGCTWLLGFIIYAVLLIWLFS